MESIWYLLDCQGKEEQAVIELCRKNIPEDILEAVWVLKCQKLLRYQGEWHVAERNLFPGYVMLSLSDRIKRENSFEEMLGRVFPNVSREERNGRLHAVCKDSRESLLKLCGGSKVIRMSRGRISGGDLVVTGGPLAGYERNIRKIDRHKRTAWVEMPGDCNRGSRGKRTSMLQRICVGLEVYEKQD